MKADMLRRLEALEKRGATHSSSDPHRMYHEVASLGLEVPEPQPGEDKQKWLSRVPTATLEAILEYGDAHGYADH
ncbi:hypothetical protein [Halomonas sp. H5]|uniref:hypothetical protein n=1 Tax=Halomonas sp. H5 TaxID=3423910 RepID=UPI003D369ECB